MDKLLENNSAVQDFIKKYNLVIHKSKSFDKVVYIRSSISTEEDAELFVKQFSQKTQTIWRVYSGDYKSQRSIFHKTWVCHRAETKNRAFIRHKSLDCEAKLDVKVKKNNKHTTKNDAFLLMEPPLTCVIKLKHKHSHSFEEDIKYLKVSDEVTDLFYGYFDNGIGVSKALKLYEDSLQSNGTQRRSRRLLPRAKQVYYLHKLWQQNKRSAGIICEDMEDLSISINIEELINTIPRIDPPVNNASISDSPVTTLQPRKMHQDQSILHPKIIPQSVKSVARNNQPLRIPQSEKTVASLPISQNVKSGAINNQPLPIPQSVPTFLPPLQNRIQSRMGRNSSTVRKIFVVNRPISNQHIALNSPSHLNGSILTVVNSRSTAPLISSFTNTQASSGSIPYISSVMSLDKTASSSRHFAFNSENSCNEHFEDTNEPSSILPNIYEHHIKVENSSKCLQLDNAESFSISNADNSASSSSIFSANSQESPRDLNGIISASQVCCPVFQEGNSSSKESSIQSSEASSHGHTSQDSLTFSGKKSSISSHESMQNPLSSLQAYPEISNSHGHQRKSCSLSIDKQFLSSSTHQSGAHISVKSDLQCTQMDIVDAVYLSKTTSNGTSMEESVKIKEEPPDDYEKNDPIEFQNTSAVPNDSLIGMSPNLESNDTVSQFKIEVEEEEVNDVMEIYNSIETENAVLNIPQIAPPAIEDEDHQFLMSLLPELKRIPKDIKVRLKSQVQNLILTARLSSCKKRSEVKSNMYHDCRILPSFPTFK